MQTIRWTARGDNGRVSVTREWLGGRVTLASHIPGLRLWSLEWNRPGGFYRCNGRAYFTDSRATRWYLCVRFGRRYVSFTSRPSEARWSTVQIL